MLIAEAKDRMRAGGDKRSEAAKSGAVTLPDPIAHAGRAAEQAAKAVNVGRWGEGRVPRAQVSKITPRTDNHRTDISARRP
jgi:hypothetical protein